LAFRPVIDAFRRPASINAPHSEVYVRSLFIAAALAGALLYTGTNARADDAAVIALGEETFNTYCSTCHGNNLVSTGQTFDLRKLKATERARFQNSVTNGKNQMPPWKGVLSEEEMEGLWRYIRANAYEQ
jgi:mono/diheme cytochrome c family protein